MVWWDKNRCLPSPALSPSSREIPPTQFSAPSFLFFVKYDSMTGPTVWTLVAGASQRHVVACPRRKQEDEWTNKILRERGSGRRHSAVTHSTSKGRQLSQDRFDHCPSSTSRSEAQTFLRRSSAPATRQSMDAKLLKWAQPQQNQPELELDVFNAPPGAGAAGWLRIPKAIE